ncbi:amino acid permease [Paenarthrobacter nitroguajacolicus]|uniref:amino acid permease n=1 Tax=Paenarthrobacter nitroguajacolicus TaxID=211146 RepID=UPI0015BC2E74|nr:amino acid permease [Paenarthrobacter nitroguajacolicus]
MENSPTSGTRTSRAGLSLTQQVKTRKPLHMLKKESDTQTTGLRRSLSLVQLTMISVGATLGTGIFVVLGDAVPIAGPAIWISFVVAGIAAMLSALSYAEMAGAVPVSGSSYSYTYVTMGEGLAWICGWCLLLEYAVSVAAVAVGAGEYLSEVAKAFGVELPHALIQPPGDGGVFNVPAVVIVLLAVVLLIRGSRESAVVNTILVGLKVVVLLLFILVAFSAFDSRNFEPLAPMGLAGITAASSRLFFSYIGFDAASTAGDEAKNPQRDLPRAIVISMAAVTVLYVAVAVAAVGARPWGWFDGQESALVHILEEVTGTVWVSLIFAIGAVIAIVSIVLVTLYGQTRILMAMSRDGMIPPVFAKVSRRTQTPVANTLITGGAIAAAAGLIPLGELADATSIGTLFAFSLVSISVIALRRNQPDIPRTFRVPLYPFTPILAVAMCLVLMVNLGGSTWIVFVIWMALGAGIYLAYGRRNSVVAQSLRVRDVTTEPKSAEVDQLQN